MALDPSLELTSTWTFDYRDPEYYLTLADGPWGELSWTYDAIGNRLDERTDRDPAGTSASLGRCSAAG